MGGGSTREGDGPTKEGADSTKEKDDSTSEAYRVLIRSYDRRARSRAALGDEFLAVLALAQGPEHSTHVRAHRWKSCATWPTAPTPSIRKPRPTRSRSRPWHARSPTSSWRSRASDRSAPASYSCSTRPVHKRGSVHSRQRNRATTRVLRQDHPPPPQPRSRPPDQHRDLHDRALTLRPPRTEPRVHPTTSQRRKDQARGHALLKRYLSRHLYNQLANTPLTT
jgi:hypothetical protein